MREWLKALYINIASQLKTPKAGVFIMNGHYLSRHCNNDPEVFISLLTYLSQFARFVSIEEAANLVMSNEVGDVTETLIAFTFDDGFDDNLLALAPALQMFKTNACFFINPGFVDGNEDYCKHFTCETVKTPGKKPMNWPQIKRLHDQGFVIGNHTQDHVRLSAVPLAEAEQQVLLGKQKIEAELGVPCEHFAWPFGQYADVNHDVVTMLTKHHRFIYSGCDYTRYQSFDGKVLNRRHFEADWPPHKVKFFLSSHRVMSD
jgi:peptidoglycan/xylan/chitin deacetylase (PgdA/CDA1 family)